ncbi:MAG: NUDIX hydrolase [Opitutales bacterium]|nr:NUDIX hydrolase [Opitutales bacterium]MCH8540275.1 NUDIX hydrolase [Opitutales bacterium]
MKSVNPLNWKKLSSATEADCRVFAVAREHWVHPDGQRKGDFFVMHCPGWVNVLALTPEKELVMVRQFRFGTRGISLEIPGGVMEDGEDPVTTGARELLEETGYCGKRGQILASVHPNPAIQSNRCHLVLFENVEDTGELSWDGNEEMEILTMSVEEVFERARNGEITHSLVIDALFYLQNYLAGKL